MRKRQRTHDIFVYTTAPRKTTVGFLGSQKQISLHKTSEKNIFMARNNQPPLHNQLTQKKDIFIFHYFLP